MDGDRKNKTKRKAKNGNARKANKTATIKRIDVSLQPSTRTATHTKMSIYYLIIPIDVDFFRL